MTRALPFDHARIKRLRRLIGRRSSRLEERAFVVEGAKVLSEALDAGAAVEGVYVVDGVQHLVLERSLAAGIRVFDMAPGVLERIADTVTPQPILAVVAMTATTLDDVIDAALATGGFVVVGVDLRDPGNAGTVIRSAEASGAAGVVLCDGSVEATNPKTVRASAGALFHVPVVSGGSALAVLERLGAAGVRLWATAAPPRDPGDDDRAAVAYDAATLTEPCALVVGNEAHGLPPDVERAVDGFLTIPMAGRTESLNVGMATAVLCFECARQRRTRTRTSREPDGTKPRAHGR